MRAAEVPATSDIELDLLLDAFCRGLYAMDPRTTFPFWDYDFAPLFSSEWIAKMVEAVDNVLAKGIGPSHSDNLFGLPSIPRKELIYSLVDMKVARLAERERMKLVSFWVGVLKHLCGPDWLSDGSNRAPAIDNVSRLLDSTVWEPADEDLGRLFGGLTIALHGLAYGLYSDVFVHQCAECRGPYDAGVGEGDERYVMLVRTWKGLRPREVWETVPDVGYDSLRLAAVYRDIGFHIDIYNHVSWRGIAPANMQRCAIWIDDREVPVSRSLLSELARNAATKAAEQHETYRSLGVESQKRLWVRQRNYQFRDFFAQAGMGWESPEMEECVARKSLLREPFWDMTLPRDRLFRFFKTCFDPRVNNYYDSWQLLFATEFGACASRGREEKI